MTLALSNLSYLNNVYTVTGSNASGNLAIYQPTTSFYNIQYSPWITSNFRHNFALSVKDATSNISATLQNSNLVISNQSSNLFNVSVAPYLLSNAYNVLKLQRYDNSLSVSLNNTAIVRISSSNELPKAFDNSYISVTASNAGSFSNVIYQSVATVDSPMQFNKPIKAISLNCSNVSSCNIANLSNQLYITNDTAFHASNVAFWSSNNLLNKNTGGAVNGLLEVKNNELRVYPSTDENRGIRLIGNGVDGNTPNNYNGGLASWWGLGFKCQLDGQTRFLHDTRNGNTYMAGNVGIGKSNPSVKLDVEGTINATNYTGATINALSNLAVYGSNTAVYNSNSFIGFSNVIHPLAVYGSNSATFASNQIVLNTSNSIILSNNFQTLSNYTYCNISTQTATASNQIISLSNSIIATNSALVNYSNYESGRVSSLSNFAYSIQSSNSTTTIYTSNIVTKTIKADDGGNLGALLMSAAGLALGGYNLFNNQGKLVNSINDTLDRLKINPSGSIELQSLLGKVGSYTDSVQVGVSTIELSNNTIYFKDGALSNTLISSNAITILNSNIGTFTVSNANLVTNCNVTGANIISLSNVAYWSSNNNINRTTETISRLYTNDLLLQSSLNTIGSGWEWSNGWRAFDSNGGYLLRNGQEGGLQFWSGTSNSGLGYHAIMTSNGNWGLGTGVPTQKLDVNGNIRASGSLNAGAGYITGDGVNAICLTLSNNTSPSLSVWCSNSSIEVGISSIVGGYSADATVGSAVIRCSSNLYLQSGQGTSAICINSNNRVGINTKTPLYVLDVSGNTRLNNALIGDSGHGTTWSAFSHSNSFSTSGYALLQNNAGRTILNCQTGQTIGFRTGNVDWGVWNATGLGVGTVSPNHKLDVSGVINNTITGGANATFTPAQRFKCDATEACLYWRNSNFGLDLTNFANNQASNKRHFVINEYADMSSGFVGIGTSAPAHKLDVAGNVNATSYTGATITSLSNLGIWSSNTARYSSNYGGTLCNLATDALNRGTFGSNAGAWASNNFIAPTVTDLSVTGNATFKAGLHAVAGTATYFPYSGGFTNNLKNFVRGVTIFADTSNAEKVGIGLTNPTEKFQVEGTSLLKELIVGSLGNLISHIGIREATINGSGGASKVVTTFTSTFPSVCAVFPTVETQSNFDDVFACSIQSKSTSQIKVITCRADGGGSWTQTITLKILVVGI
jgi:hypothetical protein